MPRLNVRRKSSSGTLPSLFSNSKTRQHRPLPTVHFNAEALGQNARRVVRDAAAGDVRRALQHARLGHSVCMRLEIAAVDLEQFVGHRAVQFGDETSSRE